MITRTRFLNRAVGGVMVALLTLAASASTLKFNGLDSRVQRAGLTGFPTTAITTEFWSRTAGPDGRGIFSYSSSTADNEWTLFSPNNLRVHVGSAGAAAVLDTGVAVNDGQWHHVAVSWRNSDSQVEVHVDGISVYTGTLPGRIGYTFKNGGFFALGQDQDSFGGGFSDTFQGEIDEFRIWNRVLTTTEIQQNMNRSLAGSAPGLFLYYPIAENSGSVTFDATTNNFNGVSVGGMSRNVAEDATSPVTITDAAVGVTTNAATLTAWVDGHGVPTTTQFKYGPGSTALRFDGVGNEIIVPHDVALNTYPLSLTAWVRVEPGGNGGLMNKYASSANGWRMYVSSGQVRAVYFKDSSNHLAGNTPGSSEVVTGPIDDGQWHQVTFTVDASGGKVYIDGHLDGSAPWVGTPGPATITAPVEIGLAAGTFLTGQMDDAAIWNAAIDTNAIADLIATGQTTGHAQYSNVVAHWDMDASGGAFVADVSGHGYDGTISGDPRWRLGARPILANQTSPQPGSGTNWVLNLDGTTNYVAVPDGVWFNGDFTVEFKAFVRRYSAYASFLDFGNGPSSDNVLVALDQTNPGKLKLWTYLGTSTSSVGAPVPVPLNQWVHLAVTLQGSTATLYQDGAIVATGTVNIPASVMRTNVFLGRPNWATDTYPDTLMDDVRIWNMARSATQIRQGITQPPDPSDPTLLLNYRFDETSGPTVVDSRTIDPHNGVLVNGATRLPLRPVAAALTGLSSGQRFHFRDTAANTNGASAGLINGFATLNPGRGTALEFDGKDDQVTGVVPQLPTGNSSYTIEAWIKPNVMNSGGIVGWGNYGVNNQVNVLRLSPTAGGGIRNYWWGNDQEFTTGPLIGEWHHVAASFDGSKRKIYVDGIKRAEAPGSGLNVTSATNLTIGKSYTTEYFDGQIDEVRIWNVARTDEEVARFSNERLVGNETGLVLYERFDEGAGPVAQGSSPNGNNLQLVGGPEWAGSQAGVGIPLAVTFAATGVGLGAAQLNGTVNLESSLSNRYWFEYGVASNLNLATPVVSVPADVVVANVSTAVTNLGIAPYYGFRLVAANDNGTNYGATQIFDMPVAGARTGLQFDGVDDYVSLGSPTELKITGTTGTWEAWIRPTAYAGMILNKEGEYEMGLTGTGQIWWAVRNSNPGWVLVNTGITAPLNEWMHVALVYNVTNMVLYTNGVPAKTNAASGAIGDFDTTRNEFRVGSRQGSSGAGSTFWKGSIDEVRVWNVARSAAQIAAAFNHQLALPQSGLLVYLRFDEGMGVTTANLGLNFNGTLVNGPLWVSSGARIIDPVVTTLPPTPVLATSATLRGSVNPSGESVITYFEYGPTAAYGSTTNTGSYAALLLNLALGAKLEQLEPGTTYHYRMVAYDTGQTRTNYGADQTFTTLVLGSGWPVSTKLAAGEAANPIHVLDGLGNSYVAGVFSGSAVFRSPLSPTGGAAANAFVGKMSRTADWLWAVNIPASSNGFTRIKAVGVDADRNIYIAGQFSGTNTFGGTNLVSFNNTNGFVAKLDSSGTNWLWARSVGGAGVDSANALTIVGTNLFVTGSFSGTADFGVSNLVSTGASDVFVAALDLNGNWLWANRGGGAGSAAAVTLVTDANQNIYVAGNYSGSVTFNTTPSVTTLTNAGGTDLFVAKLTAAGTWVLAQRGGSANNDTATVLIRDTVTTDQFYLVGQFGGTADYGGTLANQNIGNSTNMFVLRLGTEAAFTDYTQGGSAVPRAATVDSAGHVYICGEFLFTTSFGTNSLNATGNSDVFVAQMVGGDWTWAQKIGSAGTETGGSIAADADDTIVISGTYQGTIQIGYVALSTPNNRDIFVARLDANRVYEHNNYIVGQPIPVPVDAQDPDHGDGAMGQPVITILEKDRPDSDALNSFVWGIQEQKLFPVRQVTAIFKWPLTKNLTNTTAFVTAVGRITYPTNPVIHVAGCPADLEPAGAGFPLKFLNLSFTTINGASVDGGTKQFTAPAPGWSVLQFLDTGGEAISEAPEPSRFEVVRTVNWNDAPYFLDGQPCNIGAALTFTNHSDPAGKNGFVYFENAFYDGAGAEPAYNRATRTGPIIPVNKDTASATDDLVVVWSQVSANGIAWPGKPVRYVAEWPTNAAELVLASRLGSEPLDALAYPNKRVYNQPVRNLPGYNPNEEHAALYGDTLYALRNDLNNVISPKASDPYALLKYLDPNSGEWAMKVFHVVATNATFPFAYSGVAGESLVLPEPLVFLSLCNLSNRIIVGPGFQDYLGQLYARAAGPGGSGTNIVARYWYPLQPDFFYDLNSDGTPDVPVGTCIPWLDRRPGGITGTPVDITYNITWPAGVPKLELGDTWFGARPGAADLTSSLTNLAALLSASVIYDQGDPFATNSLESLVRLFDPLSARTQQLAMDFVLPATIATANDAGLRRFTDLPYSLRARLRYDDLNKRLIFSGLLDASTDYGGPDHPLLLLNVLSPRECDRIKQLSTDSIFRSAIDDLYDLTRNPNRLDLDGNGLPDQTLLIGLTCNSQTNGPSVVPEKLGPGPKALTAGPGTGTGYVTVVENNDPSLAGYPVKLHVIEIAGGPFRGDLKVLYPDDLFDEKLTVRHSGDFGGEPQHFEFEWYYMPDDPDLNHTNLPVVDANGVVTNLNGWTPYPNIPPGQNGYNDITIADGGGAGLLALADNWFLGRYRGYPINGQTNWTGWVGDLAGTGPKFAKGWVKRVLFGLNPFDARSTNFHDNASVTFASMLQQAGPRYEGDIASDSSGNNLNNIGLIEAYETVLRRARKLSVDAGINYPAANNALLLAASRISELYMLLGNEAYADAADPTIGFRTDNAGYGTLAPSIFAFQNQLDSLLEEELVLLRGRDDKSATVRSAPVYNRLFWNFTHDEGEVAYAQAYNITDQNHDGVINANDARILYPQGHGDAWGHYLSAIKTYYALLQNTNFEWVPRSESIQLAGATVLVDYQDERKFARAAAAKAKTGAELVDLTYRINYVDDPAGQYQGYKDTDPSRAWGLSEWAHRAGSGAFFDWVTGNAILPATDPKPDHVGIEKIDRTTVAELDEIISGYESIQAQVDKANAGLNPLGLAKNVVPFDIDPSQIDAGKTHFEQIYDRALEAVNNTVTVFDHANQLSQALRSLQDTANDFSQNVTQEERDYKNRMIEIFGYPYTGDIGAGHAYPSGYDGPDIYHYMYVNTLELNGESAPASPGFTAFFTPLGTLTTNVEHYFPDDLPGLQNPSLTTSNILQINYPQTAASFSFVAPATWGSRRAPGEIQLALSDLVQSEARFKQALLNYDNLLKEVDDSVDLLAARYDLRVDTLNIKDRTTGEIAPLQQRIKTARTLKSVFEAAAEDSGDIGDAIAEAFPKSVGTSTDVTAPARSFVKLGAFAIAKVFKAGAIIADEAKERAATSIEQLKNQAQDEIETAGFEFEVKQRLKELEQLIREEPVLRAEAFALVETLNQNAGRYQSAVAKGLRLMEERIAFRKNAAAETQASRYQDMTFRIFRNDAIQKYRAQFDLAARYVYLAAVAYDYETQFLGNKPGAGRAFLTDIIRQRALGEVINGVPVAGRHGLADPLARLSQNFGVLKGQLGFNNPQTETGRFSLRSELFRQRDTSDDQWRAELKKSIVPDLWQIPEFRRYCRPFAPESAGPQPGIVIRFPTTVTFGLNYFGWPLGGGDSSYDSTLFATKVRSAGVWFENYLGSGLSQTPRVYLVPVGADVLRSPSGNDLETREWRVVDQKIPVPFPIGFSSLNSSTWIPINDSLSDTFADIRRFSSFRAYHDSGVFDPSETITDSRLIGRSVWNTDWMLIIPGGTFLFDPNQGLDTFINSVGDIKIFYQTYAYSGD